MSDPVKRPWEYREHHLLILDGVSIDEFQDLWAGCDQTARSWQFWVGDALLYAEAHYGEMYSQFVDEKYIHQQRGPMWVCKRIEPARRIGDLSYSLHREVAAFEIPEQNRILKRAAREKWTVAKLKEYLGKAPAPRDHNKPPEPIGNGAAAPEPATAAVQQEPSAASVQLPLQAPEPEPEEPPAEPAPIPSDRLEELRWAIAALQTYSPLTTINGAMAVNQQIAEAARAHTMMNWVASTDHAINLIPGGWFFSTKIYWSRDDNKWVCELTQGDQRAIGMNIILPCAVAEAGLAAMASDLENAKP